MPIDLAAGSELAGHRIEAVIGRGGMGVVYVATHLRLGRRVALKVLAPDLAEDEVFRVRFIRESQMAAALEHPNIVPIYDAGEDQKALYISMRHVAGPDLGAWLRADGPLPTDVAVSVLGQVASALDAAHRAGLVHRDVKPANVLVEGGPEAGHRVFLTDFGITKSLRGDGDSLTRVGQLVGTIDYMAPEQITGQGVDGRTDVYSLGCIAYQVLTGTVPYPRDTEVAVMYAHLQETPPDVTDARQELPSGIDRSVRRAMAKAKQDRFDTCSEFIESMGASLRPADRGTDALRRARSATPEPGAARPTPPTRPSRRMLWWGGGAVAAAVVGGALALTLTGHHARGSPTTLGGPGHSTSHTSIIPSVSTSSEAPPAGPITLRWHRIVSDPETFGGPGDQVMNRALGTSRGIVAVGYDEQGSRMQPAAWVARLQGGSWTWSSLQPPSGTGSIGMASVANLGNDVVVAVGSTENNGVFRPAAWTRHGDGNWARVTSPSDVFRVTGSAQMRRVLRAGPGLVAVGYRTSLTGDKDGAIWVYDSGTRTWAPRRSPSLGGPGDQEVWSLASFHGNLFAVGTSDSEAGDSDAQVWTSSDGTFWSTVPGEPAHLDGTEVMKTVAATDNLLVAVGYEKEGSGDKDAAVWTSTDGKTWSPVLDLGVFGGPGDQEMIGVTTIDGNFVAVGYSKVGDQSIGVVWVSPDGRTWYRDKPPALQQTYVDIKSVSRVGDQLVAVGFVKDGTDKDAAAWLADVVGE